MGMSERQLIDWQSRMSARLSGMISNLGDYSWGEIEHVLEEGRFLYHELRTMETEQRCSLECDYFPMRLSQLENRILDIRSKGKGAEAQLQEDLLEQFGEMSDQFATWAAEAGTTVEDLLLRGAEAIAHGRVKKKPGPPKGQRRPASSEGPWTPQVLRAEMTRLNITFDKLGGAMDPPCGRPSVYKWIQSGIPSGRQVQITRAMEAFEREHGLDLEKRKGG